ncbi:hypothetical protein C8R43DRAFT_1129234 [Mycena crocata]|nr:hypothetical protein C8R43DRAFT_1129234 [Mycena crocata]
MNEPESSEFDRVYRPFTARKYNPPLRDSSCTKLLQLMEDRMDQPAPGLDASDYPTYAAADFETILRFLPCCPSLRYLFERQPDGKSKQTGQVYAVVRGHRTVMPGIVHALGYMEVYPDPSEVILLFPSYDEADRFAAAHFPRPPPPNLPKSACGVCG